MDATGEPQAPGASHTRRLARGGALNVAGMMAGAVMQFVLVLMVTRGLSTATAGALLEAISVFMILSNVSDLGADDGIVRGLARLRATGQMTEARVLAYVALVPVVVFGAVAGAALFVGADYLASVFFSAPEQAAGATYLRLFAVFVPIAAVVNVALSGTRGLGSMRPYVTIQNLALPAARIAALAAALAAGGGTIALGTAWALPLAVAAVWSVLVLERMIRARGDGVASLAGRGRRAVASDLWRFAGPRAVASTFGVTITYLDIVLVGAFASTREAAIYAAVSRLAVLGNFPLQAIRTAVAPQFSELIARDDIQRLRHLYQLSTWWAMLLGWPVYIVVGVFAPVVSRIFGHSYAEGATALSILCAAGLVSTGTGSVSLLLLMAGNSWLNLWNTAAALAVNIVLNIWLISAIGVNGAAIAWAASIVVSNGAALFQVRRVTGLWPTGQGFWIVAVSSLGAFGLLGLALRAVMGATVPAAAVDAVVGTVIFGAVLWLSRDVLELEALSHVMPRPRRN